MLETRTEKLSAIYKKYRGVGVHHASCVTVVSNNNNKLKYPMPQEELTTLLKELSCPKT